MNAAFIRVRSIPLVLLLFITAPAFAKFDAKDINYSIQPIIGYEAQRKQNPDRMKVVFVYGARVIAGYKILSAEGEYTHGTSNETFPASSQNIRETTDRYRLGLRSSYDIGTLLTFTLRGGAETMKRKTDTTTGAVTTSTTAPSHIDPYLGVGTALHVASVLSLVAEVVATMRDWNDMKKNDYSTTLGVQIHFNTK